MSSKAIGGLRVAGPVTYSGHAILSPSAAHRWMACPGSMSFPENSERSESSAFADDGTASHKWAATCLESGQDAAYFIDTECTLSGRTYKMDAERAAFVQDYLDDVRRRAVGGELLIEQQLDLSSLLDTEAQFGTADAVILRPDEGLLIVMDLKYGRGERVSAENNPQLMLYGLGALERYSLLGDFERVLLVINQVRLGEPDEWECTAAELRAFGTQARYRASEATHALTSTPADMRMHNLLKPGDKQCRWCAAKARCPALKDFVTEAVRADFETIAADPPQAPDDSAELGKAVGAVPLIDIWCRAVLAETERRVAAGIEIIGTDGRPMKIVEGKAGNRAWVDETQAEAALVGQLGPKAYSPQKILTAPAAGKVLDKAKTKAVWKDVFEPLIKRAPGRPVLALGSDDRKPYSGAASADEFAGALDE